MKALTFQAPEQLAYLSVADPAILDPGDVVVQVAWTAICGSDLHVYQGRETGLDPGTILGHEPVGEVVAAGRAVQRFGVGTLVVSPFSTSCGECFYCRIGLTARCAIGGLLGWVEGGEGLQGAQAEYIRIPQADGTLAAVPDGVPADLALLAGDVLGTGLFAAELGGVCGGQVVAVVGCGPVGVMSVVGALEAGAEQVVAVDPAPGRRRLAERFGARGLPPEAAPELVAEITGRRGADAVLEAVGSPAATRLAYRLARPGATLAAVGVHTEPQLALTPGELYDKNLSYRAGRSPARRFVEPALDLLAAAGYPFEELISHRLPLAEGVEAYARYAARESGWLKVLLQPGA